MPDDVLIRALTLVMPENGHLISRYSVGSHGYPQVGWDEDGRARTVLCHRAVWTARYGAIPDAMTVDHACHVRRCVDTDHLRLMTNLDNSRRTDGRDWPLGQCINGHNDAQYWHKPPSGGKGYCNECRRIRQRERRNRVRQNV